MTDRELIASADAARANAHAPYSGFTVGAALLAADGRVYTGCNLEVSSFSPTLCAERAAFAKALSEGERDFVRIAVVGGKAGERGEIPCPPCGVCRQFIREFVGDDFEILLAAEGGIERYRLAAMLPVSFGRSTMEEGK